MIYPLMLPPNLKLQLSVLCAFCVIRSDVHRQHLTKLHIYMTHFLLQVLDLVIKLQQQIIDWSDQGNHNLTYSCSQLLSRCVPLLVQYTNTYQCLMTHAVSAHRATAKLLSVLLAIFTELTTKVWI